MAAQAESARKLFYSPNGQLAFKHNRGFEAESGCWNDNLALQTHARFKRLAGDAIESFAAEIFGGALNRWSFGLAEQMHRPMHCYPRTFAAIAR